jgi:hypothetical protein
MRISKEQREQNIICETGKLLKQACRGSLIGCSVEGQRT